LLVYGMAKAAASAGGRIERLFSSCNSVLQTSDSHHLGVIDPSSAVIPRFRNGARRLSESRAEWASG
jgi:hypothetical protein